MKLYSYADDIVLDPFVGSGTTLYECWRLRRYSIGIDINPEFVRQSLDRLDGGLLDTPDPQMDQEHRPVVLRADARDLRFIPPGTVDLVVTHPPYWNAVRCSDLPDDLSTGDNESYEQFLADMTKVFHELYRVLVPDRVLAVVTGDVMRKVRGVTQLFPLHSDYLQLLRTVGFVPWDLYIWETKIRMSGGKPMMGSYPYPHKLFSQFAHNYILIARKPPRASRRQP